MTDYVINPPIALTVAMAGESGRFPVRAHLLRRPQLCRARPRDGQDPDREPPFFVTKPADAVVDSGVTVPYPPETSNFHYEIELIVAIGREGFEVSREAALDLVFGYGVGIDLTRRDLQFEARDKGRPWIGQGVRRSAPIAPLHRVTNGQHPARDGSGFRSTAPSSRMPT